LDLRGKVTRGWKEIPDEELLNLYSSPHRPAIREIESRRIRWAGRNMRVTF
jgi:hypothetical protein